MKRKILGSIFTIFMLAGVTCTASAEAETTPPAYTIVSAPTTSKSSSQAIQITWSSSDDDSVKTYYVMRRKTNNSKGTGNWKTIAKVKSDGVKDGPENSYTDQLSSSKAQQYEYKICTLSKDTTIDTRNADYEAETDLHTALGTNIKICIDPGHYGTLNNNYDYTGADGKYRYSEAKFMLKTAKALQEELKVSYGIDSYMTRTAKKISLTYNGVTYTNKKLDESNISIRGYMAKANDCDFFISLHTNSTSRTVNVWSQPKSINKTYVFVNQIAHASDQSMLIANTIGTGLTKYNQEVDIQTAGFTKRDTNQAVSFSNLANDAPNEDGTVLYRKGSSGSDYYGVLRGCNTDGIPGILVEHAFHVTKVMRKYTKASSELLEHWAGCDAYGIAYGFGFITPQ